MKKIELFIKDYLSFEKLYVLYDTRSCEGFTLLQLTEEAENLFHEYSEGKTELNEEELYCYEVIYKTVMPIAESKFYVKNTRRHTPTFSQFPLFKTYVKNFVEQLIQHDVLQEDNNELTFNDYKRILEISDDMLLFKNYRIKNKKA
ncbi:MAG: hypothetical protein K2K12_03725 [Clostridia bacterium]|nr:hypothetical protein [Clostridia bacterium]